MKARNLGWLLRAGYRVPDGFVIPDPLGDPGWEREIEAGLHRLGPGPFAARSSALAEDGVESSFAGQLATTLGVTTSAEVIEAVHRSAASGSSPEAVAYAARTDQEAPASAGVIVQVMVQPETAGVMFTRHPVSGAEQVVIEATRGLDDSVVAGTVTPEAYLVDGAHVQVARHRGGQLLTSAQALALAALDAISRACSAARRTSSGRSPAKTSGSCKPARSRPLPPPRGQCEPRRATFC
nr:PEP/pyruvate-binding domain-containing protein [Rhodococcus opacus]